MASTFHPPPMLVYTGNHKHFGRCNKHAICPRLLSFPKPISSVHTPSTHTQSAPYNSNELTLAGGLDHSLGILFVRYFLFPLFSFIHIARLFSRFVASLRLWRRRLVKKVRKIPRKIPFLGWEVTLSNGRWQLSRESSMPCLLPASFPVLLLLAVEFVADDRGRGAKG